MPNFNKVIIAGHLTRDPVLKYTPSQTAFCECGIAVTKKSKDREDTCFVDFTAWGKTAETINQYARKGAALLIEGELKYETWEAQDGTKRSKHKVNVFGFQFLTKADSPKAGSKPQQDEDPDDCPF